MGKFDDARNEKKERVERDFKVREKLAGYFFDVSKLVLTAITVASISPIITDGYDRAKWDIAFIGLLVSVFMFIIGYYIIKTD